MAMSSQIPATPPTLGLTTLGDSCLAHTIADRDTPQPIFRSGKPLALIAYLAACPGRSAPRGILLDLLWPRLTNQSARHALRQTLWALRQRFGTDLVTTARETITLTGRVECDRDRFVSAVQLARLEEAVNHYGGDFLAGLAVEGAEFEQWIDLERYRLRLLFRRSAEVAVRRRLSRGEVLAAVAMARRVRAVDPVSLVGWRLMIESLLSAGDAAGARLEADALAGVVAAGQRIDDSQTEALITLAREQADRIDTLGSPPTLAPALIARDREFSAIMRRWREAWAGASTHVRLLGGAGVGKTRLIQDLHRRLCAAGARSLYIRANPGERQIPHSFGADIVGAVAGLSGAKGISPETARVLVGLDPALAAHFECRPTDRATDARARIMAMAELMAAVSDEGPLALFLDDLHAADPPSRELLNGVLGRLPKARVLVVTASRPSPDARAAATNGATIVIPPLSPADIGALMESLAPLPRCEWSLGIRDTLFRISGGAPQLIIETLQRAVDEGCLLPHPNGWHCQDEERLNRVLTHGGALQDRLAVLDRAERWLLTLLAAADGELSRGVLARASTRTADRLLADLYSLEQRGLVRPTSEGYDLSHRQLGPWVLREGKDEDVRAAHLALGRVLSAAPEIGALRMAGRHLLAVGKLDDVVPVYQRWVHALGETDLTPTRLAATFLSPHAGPDHVARLARATPASRHAGRARVARVAGLTTLVLAGAALGFSVARAVDDLEGEAPPGAERAEDVVLPTVAVPPAGAGYGRGLPMARSSPDGP